MVEAFGPLPDVLAEVPEVNETNTHRGGDDVLVPVVPVVVDAVEPAVGTVRDPRARLLRPFARSSSLPRAPLRQPFADADSGSYARGGACAAASAGAPAMCAGGCRVLPGVSPQWGSVAGFSPEKEHTADDDE